MLFTLRFNRLFDHAQDVIQSDSKSRKTSPKPESLTWPYEVPTTLAFHSWPKLMVGCLTVASLSAVALCSRLWGRWGGLLTPYPPPQTQTTSCPMSDAPLSLSWPQRQTPGQLDVAWNPTQSPHSHHQWLPPSCPWPITQNITINFCQAAKQHTH